MLAIYAISIFVSALLLFTIQPLVGRLLLPVLGGSPAVWNTCMVFFQAALLLGYLYAHGLTRLKNPRVQVGIHLLLLIAATITLPIALPADATPPATENPVWWLCGMLALTCGAPFLMLSSSAPLLQGWFSATTHPAAKDPYFLYAASNAGSMASLLAYPFLIERHLGLSRQSDVLSVLFGCFIVFALLCGILFVKHARPRSAEDAGGTTQSASDQSPPLTWTTRLWWLALSAVPSSLLVGCTQFLTTDVAAFPLFWVIPLAIYLLTFIIAFSPKAPSWLGWSSLAVPLGVLATFFYVKKAGANLPVSFGFAVHGSMLLGGALACHIKLAKMRPAVRHLTEYFVMLSLGGVLGGAFNSLAAPALFNDVYEYPIALALAWWLGMPSLSSWAAGLGWWRAAPVSLRVALGLFTLWILLTYQVNRTALTGYKVVHQERSFFGVLRVLVSEKTGRNRHLMHGTTNHGSQFLNAEGQSIPSTYYHPNSPFGEIFQHRFLDPDFRRVAIVGLGVGATAAYGQGPLELLDGSIRPRQQFHYYEIDPAVERVAKDDRYFTFLKACKAELAFAIGDARMIMERSSEGDYDLILIDAFSSDAIPIHLITKEATELYLSKLSPNGILLFHITNRHLDLSRPLGLIASTLGLHSFGRHLDAAEAPEEDRNEGIASSVWVALVRDPKVLTPLASPTGKYMPERPWIMYRVTSGRLWTDEYADVLGAMKW